MWLLFGQLLDIIGLFLFQHIEMPTAEWYLKNIELHKIVKLGTGCGAVSRPVVSNTSGPYYKAYTIVNCNSRVILTRKLLWFITLESWFYDCRGFIRLTKENGKVPLVLQHQWSILKSLYEFYLLENCLYLWL